MTRSWKLVPAVSLAVSLAAISCGGESRPATATPAVRDYCGADYVEVERRIDRALASLDLGEKLAIVHGEPSPLDGIAWNVPGVPEHDIPPFRMIDGPRGVSRLAGNATAFPVAMARGATFDPELERRIGQAIGEEVRAVQRNVLLGPTMNILRHPRWGRAQETYGEDPWHMGNMALGFIEGAQTQVPVTAKHFAVNSIENTRHSVNVTVDERTLREVYLPHFRRAIFDGNVAGVMSAYNSVNGEFCSENVHLLRDILKTEWNFQGFVVSDWGGTEASTPTVNHAARAANAGLDLEMFTEIIYGADLSDAITDGLVQESQVDEMIRRQFRARLCYHFDTNPPVADPTVLESAAHRALAREAAERSFVLLKNQGSVLPITRGAGQDIVVTGSLANFENLGDTGSSSVTSANIVTALEGLMGAANGSTVTYMDHDPTTGPDQATITAADYVIVVAGLTANDEGEGDIGAGDRTTLALSAADVQWINDVAALSSKVIVVLEGGAAITMGNFLPNVEAVLFAWYPGVEGGTALANVLYGDVNPSGRLPIVFPVAEADLPPFDNVSTQVTYDYFHGYRHLDHHATTPLFPFGFGLSYTTFTYANLVVDPGAGNASATIRVSVDVTNSGSRAGRETVQLYVGAPASTVAPRFVRDLRAVEQVVLTPGQTQTVTLEVPVADLAIWDTATNAFRVESTQYKIEVGSSSRDLPLTMNVGIQGN